MQQEKIPGEVTHVAVGCDSLQELLNDREQLRAALTRVQERCTEQEQTIRDMRAPKKGKRPYTKPAIEELALTKGVCVSDTRERDLRRELTRKTRDLERVTALSNKQRETIEHIRGNLFDAVKERDLLKDKLEDEAKEYEKVLAAVAEQEEENATLRKRIEALQSMLKARKEENAFLEKELDGKGEDKGTAMDGEPQDFDEELRADLSTALYSNEEIATSLIDHEDVESLVMWARKMIGKEAELINENAQLQELSMKVREELVAARDALSKREDTYSELTRKTRDLERVTALSDKNRETIEHIRGNLFKTIAALQAQIAEYKEAEADGPACEKCGSHREKHDVVCLPCLNKEREDYERELKEVRAQLGSQEEVECDHCGKAFHVFNEADADSVVLCAFCGPKTMDTLTDLRAGVEELGKELERAKGAKLELHDQLKQCKDRSDSDKLHIELLEGKVEKLETENAELQTSNRSLTASKIQSDQEHTKRFLAAKHAKEEAIFERDNAQADRNTLITQYDRKCEELVAVQKERDGALRKLRGVYDSVRKVALEEPLPEWAKADDETS